MIHLTTANGAPASKHCFGTMQFGGKADIVASQSMYEDCRTAGINFFDTAYVYTGGQSETMLGRFIQSERDDVLVATKIAYDKPQTKANVLQSFEESRARMKVDMIDLLYLHRFDPTTPLEESFEALAELREDGLIRYIGISNFAAWQVMKAAQVARGFGTTVDVLQPMYNLVKRQAEVEILPACADQGIAVVPYSPLGGGLLTGKYATDKAAGRLIDSAQYNARYNVTWMHEAAAKLPAIALEHRTDAATLAVAWVAKNPFVAAPIISARSSEQLAPSLAALDFEMSDSLYDQLTALSQPPAPATDRLEEV
ncbi:aryl-alcohol dehydrogenase-like predicted oxidoreductase [Litoreibacter meonggei]|uniref:Aryl-alcohol dehydrogenase-like predicted oxidoreductase n=1 Tax=Litoreibacter meonggei TaxID=1049199 RepID=A0A497X3A8_9RHOB|nr:aldo/keto reductase [Litoreibacter meonggei]RLJ59369.1 aryl-alcohol dehydrogenase-like predicted oxidoreductase [Litoreibacter meonggei]